MQHTVKIPRWAALPGALALILALIVPSLSFAAPSAQTTDSRYFEATYHYVNGPFLAAYDSMGGATRFGLPLTEAWLENGMQYQVFENARMEWGSDGVMRLTPMGRMATAGRPIDPPVSVGPNGPNGHFILETGHTVRAPFADHWASSNGWFRLGKPISEVLDEGGVAVQYFEFAKLTADSSYANGIREQIMDNVRSGGSPFTPVSASTEAGSLYVASTGHNLSGGFLEVYQQVGGEASLGAPISEVAQENGILVQYFESGKLEYYAEREPGQRIVVSALGTRWLSLNVVPELALQIQVPPTPTATATLVPTDTPVPTNTPMPTATPVPQASGVPQGWQEISRGTSKFAGSSANRTTNIRVAARKIDGAIIQPGAVFSFNAVLGDDSEKAGFVKALVIYDGRTIEGIGGGICQVSSTVFRAAFYAGFEIVYRKAHSYRISWYEPPVGFDATVDRASGLDLKFRNTLDAPVMVKTEFNASAGTVAVVFYSAAQTKYTVKLDGPYTSNEVKHGPAIYENDPSLPSGTVKQVEYAKNGLDVKINRILIDKVTGKQTVQAFNSHYVPWRDVYKRGTGPANSSGEGSNTTTQKP